MATSNGGIEYRLSVLDRVNAKVAGWADLAGEIGRREEFADDLRQILNRLKRDPLGWGDPLYDYHSLKMTRRRGRSGFLYVYYAVDPGVRVAHWQDAEINPYGPFAAGRDG